MIKIDLRFIVTIIINMRTKYYRNSSIETKMNILYKELTINYLKDKLKILGSYVIDDNRYIFHVLHNMKEEFYIVNKNNCLNMVVKERSENVFDETAIDYTCSIGDCRHISFVLYLDDKEDFCYMYINNKSIHNKLDSYLREMFLDIYRMNTSNVLK